MPLHGPVNADNRRYLAAKATRAGHQLDHVLEAWPRLAKPPAGSVIIGWILEWKAVTGGDDRPRSNFVLPVPAYTATARVLHWVIAVMVLVMVPLGIVITNEWGGPMQQPLYNLQESLGAVLLPLVVVRLIWRLANPPLPLPADIPAASQQAAAHTVHWTLYALLLVQPLLGWIATSAYPAPVPVFGLFELPRIWGEDRALSERLFAVHRWVGIALGVVALGHIGAALQHHFLRRDRILMRMISGG